MVNQDRPPWKGDTKKLAVSIDIGTTYTAASFCVLQPGIVPKFEEVSCPSCCLCLATQERMACNQILRWPKQVCSLLMNRLYQLITLSSGSL
jgi:hypothetical protein